MELETAPALAVAPPSVAVDWLCFRGPSEGIHSHHAALAARAYAHGADYFVPLTDGWDHGRFTVAAAAATYPGRQFA